MHWDMAVHLSTLAWIAHLFLHVSRSRLNEVSRDTELGPWNSSRFRILVERLEEYANAKSIRLAYMDCTQRQAVDAVATLYAPISHRSENPLGCIRPTGSNLFLVVAAEMSHLFPYLTHLVLPEGYPGSDSCILLRPFLGCFSRRMTTPRHLAPCLE